MFVKFSAVSEEWYWGGCINVRRRATVRSLQILGNALLLSLRPLMGQRQDSGESSLGVERVVIPLSGLADWGLIAIGVLTGYAALGVTGFVLLHRSEPPLECHTRLF